MYFHRFTKMDKRTKKQQDQQEPDSQSSGVKIVSRAGKELVVEVYGEASHCLDDVGENNPAVLLDWKPEKVRAAVALANRNRPSLPSWMKPDGYPITVRIYIFCRILGWKGNPGSDLA